MIEIRGGYREREDCSDHGELSSVDEAVEVLGVGSWER